MKSRVKYLAGVALFVAVTVQAQTAPPAPLTSSEMMTRVGELKAQIEKDAKSMRHLQAVARKEKDVIKLTCVNDTLVQLKAKQNLFDESERQFQASLAVDADSARPAFDDLATTASDVTNLRAAADSCIGVPDLYKQESDATVEHPEFVDDPTLEDPFLPDLEAPAYASPYN